jgi:site-specific recombinase XerD
MAHGSVGRDWQTQAQQFLADRFNPAAVRVVSRVSDGVAAGWLSLLHDWERTLVAANYPATTRYNYLLAAAQLARYLGNLIGEGCARAAADPTAVQRVHVEDFQAWMIETRSASTALNKHKALQQFFTWLVSEEELDRSPLERVRQPRTPRRLIPVLRPDETRRVLDTCRATHTFADVRDQAIVRMLANTGGRLSEVAGLTIQDVDVGRDVVTFHGKGSKDRQVRLGAKTARALSRYLRARARHRAADRPELWLAVRGSRPISANAVKLMLQRRGERAGVPHLHAHRWRHTFAHEWKLAGGDSGDLMILLGWSSVEMAHHYGASAAAERAQQLQGRLAIGESV